MGLRNISKILKKTIAFLAIVFVLFLTLIIYANWKIPHDTQSYIYKDVYDVPKQKVALVLGASQYLRNGVPNPYFANRIIAAKELYEAGIVQCFVMSGDNGNHNYNEPENMKDALVALGVPDSIIYLDYAGFRTLDSVVRMNKIFGQNSFIIVSQEFHNQRAVFLAQYYGLEVYGYNAKDVALGRVSYKTKLREKLARVKVFIDLILNKQPKFLGDPIIIT